MSKKSKPNTCTLCKLNFKFVYELTAHFLSYHPKVKFCCYECHKVFSETELLFNHLLEKHEVQNPEKSKIALFDESRHVLARVGFLEGVQKSHEVTEFWGKALKIKEPKIKKSKVPKEEQVKKKRPSGSQRCSVPGCSSTCDSIPKVSFFSFPLKNLEKRLLWIAILNKKNKDGTDWQPSKTNSSRICSLHFVSGKHSPTRGDIDYTPTLGMDMNQKIIPKFVNSVISKNVSWKQKYFL